MDGMILYSGPLSLFSRKVEIALAEKGLAYTRVEVPFSQTLGYAPKHREVVALNPKGQVPVLVDGELKLYDSTVILEYLEDAWPEPPLYPGTAAQRARIRLLELEADEVLLQPVRALMFRTEPPGEDAALRTRQEQQAVLACPMIAANHARLDRLLEGRPFLAGVFSAADIATFVTVHWALRLAAPGLASTPNLLRWYKEMAGRHSVAAAIAAVAAADRALSYPVEKAFQGV